MKEYRMGPHAHDLARVIVLDACLLICAEDVGIGRCEQRMAANMDKAEREKQYAWLAEVLALPALWKIVMSHWPIFSFLGNGPTPELVERVYPLMVKHGVGVLHFLQSCSRFPTFLVARKMGACKNPITVMHNCVDPARFSAAFALLRFRLSGGFQRGSASRAETYCRANHDQFVCGIGDG
jgi:hypothetical protein